ncbi:MAG: sigma-70 family RNA polymerase sigma factor [Clostridia bacterium]|nr:sigma-70 family RNA polymerase sigma factor [Clostridia bacterium]MCI1999002.1 sigma-70 family RNA polymerase sigma factor [Clostridia bacterium]MCI2013752.1 sigma-70 family RNA polymerase sigma factor [Clostridia bacterium]
MDDSEIINLFFERSEQAIIELSKKYGKVCKKVSQNILNNVSDAEECVNDAYLGTWNSIPPQRPNPLLTYVCRIVRNLSIKRYHMNTAVKRNSFYDIALEELEDCIPSSNTDEEFDAKELAKVIDNFLDTLNRDSRVMFVRRYWFSDSLSEIAKMFGINEHNVSVRLFRIRKKMKKYLKREDVYL